jgi:RNA-directed DNA polymerase
VVLSRLGLHDVLGLGLERIAKPRLRGEAYLIRYRGDCVVGFQHRAEAARCQQALVQRRAKFAWALEPSKTRPGAFGRVAERQARAQGKRPATLAFLGLPHDCTRSPHGHFKVGWKTDKTRLRRRLADLQQRLQRRRHEPLKAHVAQLNQALRGHDADDGVAGNLRRPQRLSANVERYRRGTLRSRGRKGLSRWDTVQPIQGAYPLQRPQRFLPYTRITRSAVLSSHV